MELNAFNHSNIVYLVDINQQNFILASYFDVSIREDDYPSIFAIKKCLKIMIEIKFQNK